MIIICERGRRQPRALECDSEALLRSPLALPQASADRKIAPSFINSGKTSQTSLSKTGKTNFHQMNLCMKTAKLATWQNSEIHEGLIMLKMLRL
jgi:hypothetical protein